MLVLIPVNVLENILELSVKMVHTKRIQLDISMCFNFIVLLTAVCFPPTGCLNGGVCLRPSICVCQYGWTGRQCERREF